MSCDRKRVAFDTSSLIPACLNPDREPAQIFKRAVLEHDVFASPETINELVAVLARDKFNAWQTIEHRMAWAQPFRNTVILVKTNTLITECRDPKDNKFLELAISANVDVLVSSDIHLLEMHPFRGVQILQLAEFKTGFLECQN